MPILDQFGRPLPTTAQTAVVGRMRARRAELNAAYDAAETNRENVRHWRLADGLSAAQANSAEVRRILRERSRYEIANNSFACGILDTLSNDTIASGPRLQIQTADERFNQRLETAWRHWARSRNLAAILRTARKARAGDGETFFMRTDNPRHRSVSPPPVTLDVRLVECDQFEDPAQTNAPRHVGGITFDRWGNPEAYDHLETHPGDPFGSPMRSHPIDAADVIHWYRTDRPGQVRGVPEITPALPLFAMLRRYTLAVLLAAETAADFAAVLETAAAPFDDDAPAAADLPEFDGVDIDRGMMTSLPRGWKMNQFKPEQPVTSYKEFRDAILNEIARCLNMPANKARADSSGYNYASGRLDHNTYYEALDVDRADCEIDVLDRIFGWWLDEALLIPGYLGEIPPMPEGIPHRWYWDGHKHADPVKEANATKILHEMGLRTDEAFLMGEGIDPEEHYRQLERQAERRRALGLIAGTAPEPAEAP